MTNRKIIGICGYPGHGKSTAQSFLSEMGVMPIDDSKPLRLLAMQEFDLTWEQVTSQAGKAELIQAYGRTMTVREALGELGKVHEAKYGENIWIERAIQSLDPNDTAPVSFGSVRMGQGGAIRLIGGFVLAINDPNKPTGVFDFDHYDYDPVNVMVMNDGTIEQFRCMVREAVMPYLAGGFMPPWLQRLKRVEA